MLNAAIIALASYLPEKLLTNDDFADAFSDWPVSKIFDKTGILTRHIAAEDETALDLGIKACHNLFARSGREPREVDILIFCTQSPDFTLPPNSCLAQNALGLRNDVGTFDLSHGCCGFVSGLALAKAIIESRQANTVLLVTAETYSRYIAPNDRSVRTIFGDAGAATLITAYETTEPMIASCVFATDGRGAGNLIVPRSGARAGQIVREGNYDRVLVDHVRSLDNLYMNGPEIFQFTLSTVPQLLERALAAGGISLEQVDHVVLHQANAYMLEHLRIKCGIPKDKFLMHVKNVGNTVSSSIPIALEHAVNEGIILPSQRVLIAGFGVGYASAGTVVRLANNVL